MIILPAIDIYEKKAVRLYQGDYDKMTIYSHDPLEVALDFAAQGAEWAHLVDLEGARFGAPKNLEVVQAIAENTSLKLEIGGSIRSLKDIEKYADLGVCRIILGTRAVTDEAFLLRALRDFPGRIAIGADVRDGFVATHGWMEKSEILLTDFLLRIRDIGIQTLICTDIARDGAMEGANFSLYESLAASCSMDIIASGGVSSLKDIRKLKEIGLWGAIMGKAYYTGAVSLREALEVSR